METSHLGLSISRSLTLCVTSDCGTLDLLQEEASLMMAQQDTDHRPTHLGLRYLTVRFVVGSNICIVTFKREGLAVQSNASLELVFLPVPLRGEISECADRPGLVLFCCCMFL